MTESGSSVLARWGAPGPARWRARPAGRHQQRRRSPAALALQRDRLCGSGELVAAGERRETLDHRHEQLQHDARKLRDQLAERQVVRRRPATHSASVPPTGVPATSGTAAFAP
jgi:hypothetical protein